MSAGQLLETVGFPRSRQWTPVGDLSGGERRRLQLLKLLTGEPNVLMLDEPTNDLDTDTLAAVEDLLDGWPGTLIVVSHDRYLLERVTDHQLALLGDGTLRNLPGGVEQYLTIRAGREAAPGPTGKTYHRASGAAGEAAAGADPGPAGSGSAAPERAGGVPAQPASAAGGGASEAEKRQARKQMDRVEKQMQRLSERQAALHEQMAEAGQAVDTERLTALQSELTEVDTELAELEEIWLEAGELADS